MYPFPCECAGVWGLQPTVYGGFLDYLQGALEGYKQWLYAMCRGHQVQLTNREGTMTHSIQKHGEKVAFVEDHHVFVQKKEIMFPITMRFLCSIEGFLMYTYEQLSKKRYKNTSFLWAFPQWQILHQYNMMTSNQPESIIKLEFPQLYVTQTSTISSNLHCHLDTWWKTSHS